MATAAQPSSLWPLLTLELKRLLAPDVYANWFQEVRVLEETGETITLGAPSDFAAIWIHDNYLDLIERAACGLSGSDLHVRVESIPATPVSPEVQESRRIEVPGEPRRARESLEQRGRSAGLSPKNTFDSFVVGSNNQLAHAASMAVAASPAQAYNPLFLYGSTGLGKTHLMHAVGHHVLQNHPSAKVAYLSSEKFTNEFITAIQENTLTRFRQKYRNVDVLLLDDVHFLSGKERIQEEFFHTFNDLFESQKQIFLSSDRPAHEIAKLESRLVSRFQWGLVTDIQTPDYETRVAILRSKAKLHHFDLLPDVLNFIAERVSSNIRRLEGALIRVGSYFALTGKRPDLHSVQDILRDILMEEAQTLVSIIDIQKKVADYFQLRLSDMTSKRRPANIAIPRQIAMYLSRTLTKFSLQEIGEQFGGRDHGTVIHACKQVDNMMQQDDSVRQSVEFLRIQLSK